MKVAATGVLPALVLGLVVMYAHGAPLALPAINLASTVIAFLLVLLAGKQFAALVLERPTGVAFAVLCFEAVTLFAHGIDGVHRWISLGSVRLHPAAIGDPVLLLAVVVLWHRRKDWTAIALITAGLALHVVQPDAGQATSLAVGALALSLASSPRLAARLAMFLVVVAGAVLAWLRPDPLPPVDLVENIVGRAFETHRLIGVLSVGSLAILPVVALWPSVMDSKQRDRWFKPSYALAGYLSANVLVVLGGNFPTPVLGFGASPVLGAILGLGLLTHLQPHLGAQPK